MDKMTTQAFLSNSADLRLISIGLNLIIPKCLIEGINFFINLKGKNGIVRSYHLTFI